MAAQYCGSLLCALHRSLSVQKSVPLAAIQTGYVLWLERETRTEIHALIRAHGAAGKLDPALVASCNLCRPTTTAPEKVGDDLQAKNSQPAAVASAIKRFNR
jgi:hypothetical protein